MTDRLERMLAKYAIEKQYQDWLNPAGPILITVAAELDALEARIGSLKASPEEVSEWTGGVGELESAAEQNKQLDEAYRRLYAGVVGRPGIAGALQVQPEDLPEESK